MPGTERHMCLLKVRTYTYVCLRQLYIFITRENASLAHLIITRKWFPLKGSPLTTPSSPGHTITLTLQLQSEKKTRKTIVTSNSSHF